MFCILFYDYRPLRHFVYDAVINFKIVWPHTPSGTPSYKISAVDAIGQEIHKMSNEEKKIVGHFERTQALRYCNDPEF